MVLKDVINSDILIKLYKIYDSHRDAILWFLEELDGDSYEEYIQKYGGSSIQSSYFIAVCGFFELSGVIISHRMIDPDIYFDIDRKSTRLNCSHLVISYAVVCCEDKSTYNAD